jgi:hypothetical protein
MQARRDDQNGLDAGILDISRQLKTGRGEPRGIKVEESRFSLVEPAWRTLGG